jgi:hypothetical protein
MNGVRAIGPSNLTMTVEAGCILAKRERAAAVDTVSYGKWRTKWIVSKGRSYSSLEEHVVKARPRLAYSSLKERGSLLAMCSSRRADASHPNLAVPRRSYGTM